VSNQEIAGMVDLEFARSCAETIRAKHGAHAEEFVQRKIEEVQSHNAAAAVMMWRAIACFVARAEAAAGLGGGS
jgi:cytochrome b